MTSEQKRMAILGGGIVAVLVVAYLLHARNGASLGAGYAPPGTTPVPATTPPPATFAAPTYNVSAPAGGGNNVSLSYGGSPLTIGGPSFTFGGMGGNSNGGGGCGCLGAGATESLLNQQQLLSYYSPAPSYSDALSGVLANPLYNNGG